MPSGNVELSSKERMLLELVYEHFDREHPTFNRDEIWPETGAIKRLLYQRGYRKLSMDDLMARLAPQFVHPIEFSGRRLRLTQRGFRAIYRTIELNDFICFLRLGLDRYGQHAADKKVSTADIVQRMRPRREAPAEARRAARGRDLHRAPLGARARRRSVRVGDRRRDHPLPARLHD